MKVSQWSVMLLMKVAIRDLEFLFLFYFYFGKNKKSFKVYITKCYVMWHLLMSLRGFYARYPKDETSLYTKSTTPSKVLATCSLVAPRSTMPLISSHLLLLPFFYDPNKWVSESRINPPDSQSEPPSWFVVAKADRLQHSCDRGECLLLFLFSGFVPSLSSRFACVPCDLRFAMLFVVLEEQLRRAYFNY